MRNELPDPTDATPVSGGTTRPRRGRRLRRAVVGLTVLLAASAASVLWEESPADAWCFYTGPYGNSACVTSQPSLNIYGTYDDYPHLTARYYFG